MRLLSKLLAVMLCGIAGNAQAVGGLADVTIYDRTENKTLPVHYTGGKHYVVGKPGNEYQIVLRNRTGADVLTVASVDGISVITGETASFDQSGYVLSPWRSTEIRGWRKNMQRVAAFYFTELPDSYAARTGRPDNVGVIGVAVFKRKAEPQPLIGGEIRQRKESSAEPASGAGGPSTSSGQGPSPFDSSGGSGQGPSPFDSSGGSGQGPSPFDSSGGSGQAPSTKLGPASDDNAPRAAAPEAAEKSLGTGHGRNESSYARYTTFERASSTPDEITTIYYDSYRNLVAKGVIRQEPQRIPEPFPVRFVPDPPRG